MRWPLLGFACLAACMIGHQTDLLGGGGGHQTRSQAREQDRDALFVPAELAPPRGNAAERRIRLRAYVDQEYRKRLHWRENVEILVGRSAGWLRPRWGVLFDLDLRPWERKAPGDDLPAALAELGALDPGADTDQVVGFIVALPTITTSMEQLGLAELPGRHFVVRASNDPAERTWLAKAMPKLSGKELDALLSYRKAHREEIVFLHEWAHCLGAVHDDEPDGDSIMGALYDIRAGRFSDATERTLELGVVWITAPPAARAEAERRLLDHVEHADPVTWNQNERERLVAFLKGAPREAPRLPPLEGADAKLVAEAQELEAKGRWADAWRALSPLVARRADRVDVQLFGCWLASHEEVRQRESRAACQRTADLVPDDPQALILLAYARHTDGDDAGALAAIDAAGGRKLAERTALAAACLDLGFLSRAEDFGGDASGRRRKAGLARGAPLKPADEPAYLAAWEAIEAAGSDRRARLVDAAAKRFGDVAGLPAQRCRIEGDRGRWREADAACTRAFAGGADLAFARASAARAAAKLGRRDEQAAHLERLIELTPEDDEAWHTLVTLYRAAHDEAKLDALRRAHLQRRHSSLPE